MKEIVRFSCLFVLLVAFSQPGVAQLPALSIDAHESWTQSVTILGNQSETDVPGAPFSAIEESKYSQRQPDGSLDDRSSDSTHIYRDGQGRTRADRYSTSYLDGKGKSWLSSIYIADPVAGFVYRLDPENHLATRWHWDATSRAERDHEVFITHTAEESAAVQEVESHATMKSLGSTEIEGLTVEGYRQAVSVPAETEGNERPFKVMAETWISPELKIAVLTIRDDSIVGVRKTQLTKIDRTEPDPELFHIPPDYKLEDGPTPGSGGSNALP
jgi:hypothetical protein